MMKEGLPFYKRVVNEINPIWCEETGERFTEPYGSYGEKMRCASCPQNEDCPKVERLNEAVELRDGEIFNLDDGNR